MLDLSQMLTYVIALAIAVAIPGPGITALVARSVSSGAVMGFAMLSGVVLGDLTYLSFAVFGLAILAKSFSVLFLLVKWGSMAYLCYLAWQFWTADYHSLEGSHSPSRKDLFSAAISGYTLTLGNPKTIAFYLALLPIIIDLQTISVNTWALVLIPLTAAVLLGVGAVFILAAVAVRSILSSKQSQKLLHRSAAVAMILAAGTVLLRE